MGIFKADFMCAVWVWKSAGKPVPEGLTAAPADTNGRGVNNKNFYNVLFIAHKTSLQSVDSVCLFMYRLYVLNYRK